jgi:hypothetical protein
VKKFPAYTIEDWLKVVVGVLLITVAALFIASIMGCTAAKQTKYEVRYVKGCSIDLSVATVDTANQIIKGVNMEDCELGADTEDEQ